MKHMTRAKRYRLTYAAINKMAYLAGFAEGIAQERRMVDRINNCNIQGWNRAQKEADQLETERDEARRERDEARAELEAYKARRCEYCLHYAKFNDGTFGCLFQVSTITTICCCGKWEPQPAPGGEEGKE